jgi:hypothetical protein
MHVDHGTAGWRLQEAVVLLTHDFISGIQHYRPRLATERLSKSKR